MGNNIFGSGTKATSDLPAGLHPGTITSMQPGQKADAATGEIRKYFIFKGFIDRDGSRTNLSAIANFDTRHTKKLVRWMLALDGKMPEQVDPETLDLATLPDKGQAMFLVTYEQQKRLPDGTYVQVRSDFPQLADILPLAAGEAANAADDPGSEHPF